MFSLSVSDLLVLDEFKGLSEAQIISVEYDKMVLDQASTVGMDITKGYEYFAAQHRNIQGKVVIGFILVGELRNDKLFRESSVCSTELRTLCHISRDVSLTQEMVKLSGGNFSYGKDADEDVENDRDYQDGFEEGYKAVEKQIDMLNDLATHIRGCSIGENGGLKRYQEWHENK